MAQPRSSQASGIVVLGSPRSGTTLLRRILDAHPSIACPPETNLLSAAARFLHEESFTQGLRIGVLSGLWYAGFTEVEVVNRLRDFVFSFLREHAAKEGKARWAEKSAFDAFHVPAIRRLTQGHVRFVCLQRHGLDVVCSISELVHKTGGYVPELHAYVRRCAEPLHAFAHAWVDVATAIAELAEGDDAIAIRYEDLVHHPSEVVRRVLSHVGEPWDDAIIERGLQTPREIGFDDWKTYSRTRIDTSSVGRWRKLPRAARARLAEICNPTLERLGYPRVEPQVELDEDPRRRYELGLLINRMKAD